MHIKDDNRQPKEIWNYPVCTFYHRPICISTVLNEDPNLVEFGDGPRSKIQLNFWYGRADILRLCKREICASMKLFSLGLRPRSERRWFYEKSISYRRASWVKRLVVHGRCIHVPHTVSGQFAPSIYRPVYEIVFFFSLPRLAGR